ncbi:hypothetical protein [Chamaesiphon minutus]|nr:hypothetical protein [Chamaesiphon minutus]
MVIGNYIQTSIEGGHCPPFNLTFGVQKQRLASNFTKSIEELAIVKTQT